MGALVLHGLLLEPEVRAMRSLAQGKLVADDVAGQTTPIFGRLQRRKHRLALPGTNAEGDEIARLTAAAVARSRAFQIATYPRSLSRPRLCCYGPGMSYRDHLDIPLIGKTQLRTDVSVTVSLSDAASYEGGDLVIDSDRVERRWKGDAGDCIVYPSDSIHRVDPVISGERMVIIFWVESAVRDPSKRQILFDLATGFVGVDADAAEAPQVVTMRQCHGNLLRMWAEP